MKICAGAHQAFLVRKRNPAALRYGRERGTQARRTDDAGHHTVGRSACSIDERSGPSGNLDTRAGKTFLQFTVAALVGEHGKFGLMEERQLRKRFRIAVGGQGDDLEQARIATDDVQRVLADGPCGSEHRDALAGRPGVKRQRHFAGRDILRFRDR